MKLKFLAICALTATLGVTSALAAEAPAPAPMEGGSPISNEVATRFGVLSTAQSDFYKAVGAMMQDYAKISGDLRAAKIELERKDALASPVAPGASPAPPTHAPSAPTPAPAPPAH